MTKANVSSKGQSAIRSFPDWRTTQGMASDEESLTQALEAEHRAELAREDAKLEGH